MPELGLTEICHRLLCATPTDFVWALATARELQIMHIKLRWEIQSKNQSQLERYRALNRKYYLAENLFDGRRKQQPTV